jgi:predicted RNA-binding protein with PUA-like domain
MHYWLLKSEADCYSIDDLRRDTQAYWDGVRNYQARNFLRDGMKKGDLCLFYHSGGNPPAAVGVCRIVGESYPDPTQFDPAADHYDADSDPDNPRWVVVDIAFEKKFAKPVGLDEMKKLPELRAMRLLQRGNRLSVMPVEKAEFETVVRLGA